MKKAWFAELNEVLRGRLKYLSASGESIKFDEEELENLIGNLTSFCQDRMQDAYVAGHAAGAMSNVPDDQVYDFDGSLDSFHAKSKFGKWLADYEDS